jgi:hypothetical protein
MASDAAGAGSEDRVRHHFATGWQNPVGTDKVPPKDPHRQEPGGQRQLAKGSFA